MHVCMWQWNVFCPEITSCLRRMRSSTASSTRSCSPTTRNYGRPNLEQLRHGIHTTLYTVHSAQHLPAFNTYIHIWIYSSGLWRCLRQLRPRSYSEIFQRTRRNMSSENWLVFIPYIYIHIHIIYTHIDTKIVIIMYIFYVCCVSIRTYYVICGLHVVCVCFQISESGQA